MSISLNKEFYSSIAVHDIKNEAKHPESNNSKENFKTILHFLLYVNETTTLEEIQEIYHNILLLLPTLTPEEFNQLIRQLKSLLLHSATLHKEQRQLALEIGNWFANHLDEGAQYLQSCLKSMRYYVKAFAISTDPKEVHEAASTLCLKIIEKHLLSNQHLENKLQLSVQKADREGFQAALNQIDTLKAFCTEKDKRLIQYFYQQAGEVLLHSNPSAQAFFKEFFDIMKKGEKGEFATSTTYLTQKYSQNLENFRKIFLNPEFQGMLQKKPSEIRQIQTNIFKHFTIFFHSLLKDAYAILAEEPPCNYDFRAMGSVSREEPSPYSDLEWMILIEDEKYKEYFVNLALIIELLTLTLGESGEKESNDPLLSAFSCLRKSRIFGFQIDGNPAEDQGLIGTPSKMANLQNGFLNDPATINHTVQKSISLAQSTPELFQQYQTDMWNILDAEIECIANRQKSSYAYLKERYKDFMERWTDINPPILNIKKQYVELLNHTLSDLALYFGVKKVNTLDIIDDLVNKEIFSPRTGDVLKEAVAAIFSIRVRLHCFYGERNDEGSKVESQTHCVLTQKEQKALRKIYWLVIHPLFHCLNVAFEKKQLESIFNKLDLMEKIFDVSEPSLKLPWPIYYAAKTLAKYQATEEEHNKNYIGLMQFENQETTLRISYIKAVLKDFQLIKQLLLIVDTRKRSLMHLAAEQGDIENLQLLLKSNAEKEALNSEKRTPLHLATIHGHLEVVKLLISYNVNLLAISREKENVIHYAAFNNKIDILKIFLQKKEWNLLINEADSDGKTPLHKAVWGDPKPDIVELLLNHGANPKAKNIYNYTALHWAAKHGHLKSAKLLLEKNADRSAINDNGHTPLQLAIKWEQDNAARLLIDPSKDLFTHADAPPPMSSDHEAYYLSCFEQAYKAKNKIDQILYLEKIGEFFFEKGEYARAAKIFNNALAAAQLYEIDFEYQKLLLKKLERLEGYFLKEFEIKTSAEDVDYLQNFRHFLKTTRQEVEAKFPYKPIEQIQEELTYSFKNLLSELIKNAIKLLKQNPPTSYAIIALGLMSRNEMNPYSKVKFAILIEDNSPVACNYFRTLSKFLELRIINLGETKFDVIPPEEIKMGQKSSFTPNGFASDHTGLTPLGKNGIFELIGTPEQLAFFQEEQFLEKHQSELNLVHALVHASYMMGNQILFNNYTKQVDHILNSKKSLLGKQLRQTRSLQLLKTYLEECKSLINNNGMDLTQIDLKDDLYHPLQKILAALALYHNIKAKNTFEIIQKLKEKKIFITEGAKNLQKILKLIMNWRLRAQLFYQSENEFIIDAKDSQSSNDFFTFNEQDSKEFLEIFRVLIPFCKAAQAFLEEQKKSFSENVFYNEKLEKSLRKKE